MQPGRMLLIDTEQGRIVSDEEIKENLVSRRPYRKWLDRHLLRVADLPEAGSDRTPSKRVRI